MFLLLLLLVKQLLEQWALQLVLLIRLLHLEWLLLLLLLLWQDRIGLKRRILYYLLVHHRLLLLVILLGLLEIGKVYCWMAKSWAGISQALVSNLLVLIAMFETWKPGTVLRLFVAILWTLCAFHLDISCSCLEYLRISGGLVDVFLIYGVVSWHLFFFWWLLSIHILLIQSLELRLASVRLVKMTLHAEGATRAISATPTHSSCRILVLHVKEQRWLCDIGCIVDSGRVYLPRFELLIQLLLHLLGHVPVVHTVTSHV